MFERNHYCMKRKFLIFYKKLKMSKSSIPKIIWQTYKTHSIPNKWSSSPESLKKYHPTWKYHLTDDQENRQFMLTHYPEYLNLYDRLGREVKPICQVDMIRILRLHKYGGVYIDLDYEALKPFDDLFSIDSDLYLFRTSNLGGFTNSFLASIPGCYFWIKCIEKIIYRLDNKPWYILGDLRVLWTTGPGMLTDVANEYNKPYVTIPYKLGHPCNICDHYLNRVCTASESYVKELKGSSWTDPSVDIFYFMVCRWEYILSILFLILLIILFYFILYRK
jgi:mannosyltransferase OCH1-like enzyme